MINPFKDVDWQPDLQAKRRFAKSLIIGFPAIALVFLVGGFFAGRGWDVPLALRIGGIGAAAGLVFLAVPAIVKPFYTVWYALACSIGFVVSNVLIAAVFYLVFATVGLVMRAIGRRPVEVGLDRAATTYWRPGEPAARPDRYLRQF